MKDTIPMLLHFVDTEKAFDWLDWAFIKSFIQRTCLGNHISNWVKLLCQHQKANISLEGAASNTFNISRDVQQGCPLSPLRFNTGKLN